LGRNCTPLPPNAPISNISIILSLGIAKNWEFSYKYAPYVSIGGKFMKCL
jgi:hypothetical protein